MRKFYHARDDDALRDGSFVVEYRGKQKSAFARYMLGDFQGWETVRPVGLQEYPARLGLRVRASSRRGGKR